MESCLDISWLWCLVSVFLFCFADRFPVHSHPLSIHDFVSKIDIENKGLKMETRVTK